MAASVAGGLAAAVDGCLHSRSDRDVASGRADTPPSMLLFISSIDTHRAGPRSTIFLVLLRIH